MAVIPVAVPGNSVGERGTKRHLVVPVTRRRFVRILPDGKIKLPDFKGVDMRRAAGIIRQGRLRLKPHGSGFAYKQEPRPGTVVDEGRVVEIWFK